MLDIETAVNLKRLLNFQSSSTVVVRPLREKKMAALCPTGGSYWNPKFCWWCTSSQFCTVLTRFYDIIRIFTWVLGRLVDAFLTILFQVIIPFVQLVFYGALSFINFLVGLLFGEFRFGALTIFAPIFLLVFAWLLWLFWPQVSCFIEDVAWPFLNFYFDFLGLTLRLLVTIVDALIRMYNALVPIIGFVIYLGISVITTWFAAVVSILGAFDLYALVGALLEIVVLLAEIVIEVLVAVVTAPTGVLSEAVEVIGPAVAVILDAVILWARVLTWIYGRLWVALEPILDTLVKVVRYVKKHFFARAMARSLLGLESDPPLREMSTSDDLSDEMWHVMGKSGSRYWDDDNGNEALDQLHGMNSWRMRHSPQHIVDYYYLRRASLLSHSMGHRRLMQTELPEGWVVDDEQQTQAPGPEQKPGQNHPHLDDIFNHLHERISRAQDDVQSHPMPIEEEIATHKVECKSAHCGGEGTPLDHPLKKVIHGHKRLRPLEADSPQKRRNRLTHAAAMAHVARHTIRHHVHKFWYEGDGTFPRHAARAWQHLTGHKTLHHTLEHLTTQRKDPAESVATFVPVLSEWQPFAWILSQHPEEYQQQFLGHHVRRHVEKQRQKRGEDEEPFEHPPLHYMGDVMSHHERRGIFDPEGNQEPDDVIATEEALEEQPSIPFLQLLYRADCYTSKPRNPLCLPEIAPQLPCLLEMLLKLFPDKPPVEFCDYEEQCTDLGFCIVERPDITPDLIFILNNVELWLSLCWIQNGIVWIFVVIGSIFGVVRLTFQVLSALLPFLAWFFDLFIAIIPEIVSLQDLVCLLPFFYGFVLLVVLILLFKIFVLPLIRLFFRSFVTLEAMFGAIRSIETTMLAYKQNAGYAQVYRMFYATPPRNVLPYDPWTGQPVIGEPKRREFAEDPLDNMRAQMGRLRVYPSAGYMPYIPLTGAYEPGGDVDVAPFQNADVRLRNASTYAQVPLLSQIGADEQAESGLAGAPPDELDKEQQGAKDLYFGALSRGLSYFGEPSRVITSQDVHTFEVRWRPFLHSAHWSYAWLRRYINEYHHRLDKAANRSPPSILPMRGWFSHLF